MIHRTLFAAVSLASLLIADARAGSVASDAKAITAAVDGFHDALHRGDAKAALRLLAPDASILENGSYQTREDYARKHLAEDIAFSQAVSGTRSHFGIKQEGTIAWTTATIQSVGNFRGHKIDSVGVELMVLAKTGPGWRICAIHWSNQHTKK